MHLTGQLVCVQVLKFAYKSNCRLLGSSDIWNDRLLKRMKPLNKLYIWIVTNKCTVVNSSFLYHAWGLYHHRCLREEYKGNTISYISKVNELRNAVPNAVIPFVELTIKCKIRPFFWKAQLLVFKLQLLSGSTVDFLLYTRRLFVCEIIEVGLFRNILSDEFVFSIAPFWHET